ncbi:MAG: sigma-70 family RNA polymerase sigma factor [Acidobacteriota bacterium]
MATSSPSDRNDPAGLPSEGEISRLLHRWRDGDPAAADRLLPLVYEDLRQVASKYLASERIDHSLQATELVHEAFLRLSQVAQLETQDRQHFFSIAARAMRRILVDHARRYRTDKRERALRVPMPDELPLRGVESPEELLALTRALTELQKRRPRPAQLVELRFFGGLSEGEAADVLGISRSTVARDWRFAKVWLTDFLSEEP